MSQPRARLWYTSRANRDVDEITGRYEEISGPDVALRFLDALDHTLDLVRTSPGIGIPCHRGSHRDLRRIPLSGSFDLWMLYYTPSATEIRVDRVFHSARDTKILFSR